jgi:hypothetical protein
MISPIINYPVLIVSRYFSQPGDDGPLFSFNNTLPRSGGTRSPGIAKDFPFFADDANSVNR